MNRRLFFAAVASLVLGRKPTYRIAYHRHTYEEVTLHGLKMLELLRKHGRVTYRGITRPLPCKTLGPMIQLVNQ